jgi:transcriptional regulator with XRE-family HTH domain
MEYCDQLARNLQRLVEEGECSVIDLARFADVSRDAIYQFLDRRSKDLGVGKAMGIADGIKIPLSELVKKDFRIPARSA